MVRESGLLAAFDGDVPNQVVVLVDHERVVALDDLRLVQLDLNLLVVGQGQLVLDGNFNLNANTRN